MIGALPTVGLVILTAVVGVWLLRLEGLATLQRVQEKLNRGEIPETELLEGIMLVFGGALLLTPGFVTDITGFICLIPGLRKPIASWIIRSAHFRSFQMKGNVNAQFYSGEPLQKDAFTESGGTIINGEFEADTRQNSGQNQPDSIDKH